jgi:hypothetical protein
MSSLLLACFIAPLWAAEIASTPTPHCVAGEKEFPEEGLKDRGDILFFSGFETESWEEAWGMQWGPSPQGNLDLAEGKKKAFRGVSARVKYGKGEIGGDSACQFYSSFRRLGIEPRDSACVRYYLRFDPGFDFVKGGKLPGFAGGTSNTGGRPPNGRDGFSARLMWRENGRIVQYVYYPDQQSKWGDDFPWMIDGKPCVFEPGKWHCVETCLTLNSPGKKDGVIRSFLDGKLALERTDIRFRDIPELKIDAFYFSTFFGGGDKSWAPPRNEHIGFDDFVIAESYIGPCITPTAGGKPGKDGP